MFSHSAGDRDIWVNKTEANFKALQQALKFFSTQFHVFSFRRPPYAIEILTALKGISSFTETFNLATIAVVDNIEGMIEAREAAGRRKDKNDSENLKIGGISGILFVTRKLTWLKA